MGSWFLYLVAVSLLCANAGVWVWNQTHTHAPDTDAIALTEAGVPSLELLPHIERVAYRSGDGIVSSCYTLGPYNSEKSALLMMARIRNYGLAVQIRSMRTLETLNYLVYIPPLPTRHEAEAIIQDMQRFDVTEHLVVEEGPYQHAISLGFFDDVRKAMRHAEYVRYLGYDARYTEQKAAREVFWLDYDEPFGSNTPVLVWSESVDPTSRVQLIPRACAN